MQQLASLRGDSSPRAALGGRFGLLGSARGGAWHDEGWLGRMLMLMHERLRLEEERREESRRAEAGLSTWAAAVRTVEPLLDHARFACARKPRGSGGFALLGLLARGRRLQEEELVAQP